MKIGIVLAKPPAYSETFFTHKIKGLITNGFDVEIYCQEPDSNFNLCPVFLRPQKSTNVFKQAWLLISVFIGLLPYVPRIGKFLKLERENKVSTKKIISKLFFNSHLLKCDVDWLHFGFGTFALERENIAESIGAKMAVSFRGFDLDVYPLKDPDCYELLWRKANKIHFISDYLLQKAAKFGLPNTLKYEIIFPAIDSNQKSGIETFGKNTFSKNKITLLTIARLHWIKGLDILISTANILKEKKIDFEWLIIGSGAKKEVERYKYHVYEKELEEYVKFLGRLSHQETWDELYNADLYVQTSLSEGFCNAILEAQSLGKSCIAFNVGGISENILDNETGWLAEEPNSRLMAKKIIEVLKLEESFRLKISNNAKFRVIQNFNIERQRREFLEFYNI